MAWGKFVPCWLARLMVESTKTDQSICPEASGHRQDPADNPVLGSVGGETMSLPDRLPEAERSRQVPPEWPPYPPTRARKQGLELGPLIITWEKFVTPLKDSSRQPAQRRHDPIVLNGRSALRPRSQECRLPGPDDVESALSMAAKGRLLHPKPARKPKTKRTGKHSPAYRSSAPPTPTRRRKLSYLRWLLQRIHRITGMIHALGGLADT